MRRYDDGRDRHLRGRESPRSVVPDNEFGGDAEIDPFARSPCAITLEGGDRLDSRSRSSPILAILRRTPWSRRPLHDAFPKFRAFDLSVAGANARMPIRRASARLGQKFE